MISWQSPPAVITEDNEHERYPSRGIELSTRFFQTLYAQFFYYLCTCKRVVCSIAKGRRSLNVSAHVSLPNRYVRRGHSLLTGSFLCRSKHPYSEAVSFRPIASLLHMTGLYVYSFCTSVIIEFLWCSLFVCPS